MPVTFRYLGEQFDVGMTAGLIYLNTTSDVVIIDGVPTATGRQQRTHDVGFGDLVFRGRYYALDDPGLDSLVPALTPFLKVKAPTADARKGLGTGEWDVGFGVELTSSFASSSCWATSATPSSVIPRARPCATGRPPASASAVPSPRCWR